jgi:hypothetical protein
MVTPFLVAVHLLRAKELATLRKDSATVFSFVQGQTVCISIRCRLLPRVEQNAEQNAGAAINTNGKTTQWLEKVEKDQGDRHDNLACSHPCFLGWGAIVQSKPDQDAPTVVKPMTVRIATMRRMLIRKEAATTALHRFKLAATTALCRFKLCYF